MNDDARRIAKMREDFEAMWVSYNKRVKITDKIRAKIWEWLHTKHAKIINECDNNRIFDDIGHHYKKMMDYFSILFRYWDKLTEKITDLDMWYSDACGGYLI